jgi:phosphoribosyl-ATP pyrophosphohydrolase/phosphoribosyl-AMP cyclohydrolase
MVEASQVRFDEQGLIPAIVQDWRDGTVLMLGYMNREAFARTLASGRVHFWSRSRNRLWAKGETSGNHLLVKDLFLDCDGDALLVKAEPVGPTCHTGERACFFTRLTASGAPEAVTAAAAAGGILDRIAETIAERRRAPNPESYVARLFAGGEDRILKKVVEEAGEVVLASKGGKPDEVIYETADVLFHLLLVLGYHGITLEAVYRELAGRFGKPGLRKDGREGATS